jgi:hypothetical protein
MLIAVDREFATYSIVVVAHIRVRAESKMVGPEYVSCPCDQRQMGPTQAWVGAKDGGTLNNPSELWRELLGRPIVLPCRPSSTGDDPGCALEWCV